MYVNALLYITFYLSFSLFFFIGWGRAAAGTYLVGFVILCICFCLAVIAFSIDILRFNFVRGIGGLLFVVGKAADGRVLLKHFAYL